MKRSGIRGAALALSAVAVLSSAAGCAHAGVTGREDRPSVLVVPASPETRLLTSRRCEYLGVPRNAAAVTATGANVAMPFVQNTSSSTRDDGTLAVTYTTTFWSHAVVLRCPDDVVAALAQLRTQEARP